MSVRILFLDLKSSWKHNLKQHNMFTKRQKYLDTTQKLKLEAHAGLKSFKFNQKWVLFCWKVEFQIREHFYHCICRSYRGQAQVTWPNMVIYFFRTALLEAGFTPDDYYFDPEMDNTEQSILLLQNGQQTQLSFQPIFSLNFHNLSGLKGQPF